MKKFQNFEAMTISDYINNDLTVDVFENFYNTNKIKLEVFNFLTKKHHSDDLLSKNIPIVIKDNMYHKGHVASAGTKILQTLVSPFSSTVVQKLQKNNFTILGRSNMDAFAMGSYTQHSFYGMTYNVLSYGDTRKFSLENAYDNWKNNKNTRLSPHGSSGGSAVAVASGMVLCSLGTDTGGSVLEPSSVCGTVGLIASYSAISRYGVIELSSSLDKVGIFGKTVNCVKYVADQIYGYDKNDPCSFDIYTSKGHMRAPNGRVAILDDQCFNNFDGVMKDAPYKLKDVLEKQGYVVDVIKLKKPDHISNISLIYSVLCSIEAFSNMSRFKPWLYGKGDNISKIRTNEIPEYTVIRLIIGAFYSLSHNINQYRKILMLCQKLSDDIADQINHYDCIISPIRDKNYVRVKDNENSMFDLFDGGHLSLANITGRPAMYIPMYVDDNGLPVGVHILGHIGGDFRLLDFAEIIDKHYKFNTCFRGEFKVMEEV